MAISLLYDAAEWQSTFFSVTDPVDTVVETSEEKTITGYGAINNILGQPAALLRVACPERSMPPDSIPGM